MLRAGFRRPSKESNVRTHAETSVLPAIDWLSEPAGQLVHEPLLIELYVLAGQAAWDAGPLGGTRPLARAGLERFKNRAQKRTGAGPARTTVGPSRASWRGSTSKDTGMGLGQKKVALSGNGASWTVHVPEHESARPLLKEPALQAATRPKSAPIRAA